MGSGSLGREIDLNVLVDEMRGVVGESLEVKFHSDGIVTIRLEKDGPAFTVYRTGTFQIRGPDSEDALEQAESSFREILHEIDFDVPSYDFDHVTSVFVGDLGQSLNLSAVAIILGLESIEYEPEQFPGLIYRPPKSPFVLLVFASGKVVITGGTNRSHAKEELNTLQNQL
jgi:transcription initiation factor TFIID TATA-box-binding protein